MSVCVCGEREASKKNPIIPSTDSLWKLRYGQPEHFLYLLLYFHFENS